MVYNKKLEEKKTFSTLVYTRKIMTSEIKYISCLTRITFAVVHTSDYHSEYVSSSIIKTSRRKNLLIFRRILVSAGNAYAEKKTL
jgi:hypothetical protein